MKSQIKKSQIKHIPLDKIKSKWYKDIFAEWEPNHDFIQYLHRQIEKKEYIPPIILVLEGDVYYIVNGHHRYYAFATAGEKTVKAVVIEGTFEESEPLRKAEVLLKEFDIKTDHKYQFSGYLDRWAAYVEKYEFIDKYRPSLGFKIFHFVRKLKNNILKLTNRKRRGL